MNQGAADDGKRAADRRNLRLRIASGLILGVFMLAVTLLGGFAFRLFAAVLAALVFYEWTAMNGQARRASAVIGWAALAAALAVMIAGASALLSLAAIGVAFFVVLLAAGSPWAATGIAYAGVPALALTYLRGSDEAGLIALLFLFAVVWATDVLAYFVGRALGGPKLAPAISPGKTWSGAIGGAMGGVAAGTAVVLFAGVPFPISSAVLISLLLSAVSQAGDLFESFVKRRHDVKDSGSLIPGHGGVMDRVDGLVAAAVLLYLLGILVSGLTEPAGFFSR